MKGWKKKTAWFLLFILMAMTLSACNGEEEIEEAENLEETYDVVVIGGGGAGLSAAIEAQKNGAQVVLLEKMHALGGNTLVSGGGLNAPNTEQQERNDVEDSVDLFIEDTLVGGDHQNDEALVRIMAEEAQGVTQWLQEEIGVNFISDRLQQLVDAKGEQIDAWFEMRIEEVHGYARSMEYFDLNREEALSFLIEQQQVRSDVYESLGVISPEGDACITNGACFSIRDREYYQRIERDQSQYVISQPIESQANEESIVVILYEVEGTVSREVAYVSAAIDLGKINEIARDIQLYEGQGSIIDSEGQVIGTRDPLRDENTEIQVFDTRVNPAAFWRLMFEVEEQQMSAGLWRLQYRALMIGILVAAVLLILLFVLIKSIVYPVRKLQNLMEKVQTGDTKVHFAIEGKDEINQLGGYFNDMLKDLDRIYTEKQEADYRLLQEQVKPHFLYNTLDTIRWSAEEYEAHEVAELIEALSEYFRIGFNQGKKFVTLEEELTHLESYLRIQEARFEELLDYEISYDEALLKERVPKIILQPLAENAINHSGLLEKQEKCFLSVRLEKRGEDLWVEVEDKGVNLTEEEAAGIQKALVENRDPGETIGFGLYWINHRIKQICGEKYGVFLEPLYQEKARVGTGVRVVYCLKGVDFQ